MHETSILFRLNLRAKKNLHGFLFANFKVIQSLGLKKKAVCFL